MRLIHPLDQQKLRLLQEVNIDTVMTESEFAGKVHPTILRLGLAYASGTVRGSNARAVALLTALSQMFQVCCWHASLWRKPSIQAARHWRWQTMGCIVVTPCKAPHPSTLCVM